jgi:hypothetical protein
MDPWTWHVSRITSVADRRIPACRSGDRQGGSIEYVQTLEPGDFTFADLDAIPDDGMQYELVVQGDEVFEAKLPYPVRIVPAELVR